MNKFFTLRGWQFAAGSALLLLSNLASAQFVWIDEKGVKQFSDQAPPASIPMKNILKAPNRSSFAVGEPSPAAEAAPSAASASASAEAAKPVDREAEFRKRQKLKADAEAKAEEASTKASQKQTRCAAGRAKNDLLASGKRLRSADGSYMDDAARSAQQADASKAMADCN
jgi:outer membrane biosynthesis protein TonB